MDWHLIQGGVAIVLGMLHAKETGISSGCWGIWSVCVFTFTLPYPQYRPSYGVLPLILVLHV